MKDSVSGASRTRIYEAPMGEALHTVPQWAENVRRAYNRLLINRAEMEKRNLAKRYHSQRKGFTLARRSPEAPYRHFHLHSPNPGPP
jgi:hypothetical protein